MMHSNKMILVPHEMVGDPDTPTTKLMSVLDNEMLKILQDATLADDVKIIKYNQILQRYQGVKQEKEKPFQLEIKKTKLPIIVEEEKQSPLHETVYNTVPPKFHKQANLLLEYVQKNPHLKWSPTGEMIVDNNKIAGSNIIDLINDFVRNRKIEPAIGASIFMKKLAESNIPREAIVNKERLKLLEQEDILAENEEFHETQTPTKSSPAKKQLSSSEKKKGITWRSLLSKKV